MDDQRLLQTPASMTFATPLDGLDMKPLTHWNDHGAEETSSFVTGKIIGIVPSVGWRYDRNDRNVNVRMPYTKWWALVCKSTDEQVTEANLRASAHSVRIGQLVDDNTALAKTEKELRAQLAAVQGSAEQHAQELGKTMESRNEKTRTLMKIEQDLAKVKKHFGEKAFADALATGK